MPAEYDRGVYANKPAWHKWGDVKTGFFNADQGVESLEPSGEGVIKASLTYTFTDKNGVEHSIPDPARIGLVDFDETNKLWRPQGVKNKDYGLVQLAELFAFMDAVIDLVDDAHYDAAVKLRGGSQTVLSAYLGDYVLDPGGRADRQQKYLWGFNSINGSWSLRLKKGEYRIECANMAAMALRGSTDKIEVGTDWVTRHTKNVMDRIAEAKTALKMWNRHDKLFQAEAEHMIQTLMNDDAFDRALKKLYTDYNAKTDQDEVDKEAVEAVRMIYDVGKHTRDITGTVWGAFNAVTEREDHFLKFRGGKNTDISEKKLDRMLQSGRKQKAWDLLWDYAAEQKPFKVPELV